MANMMKTKECHVSNIYFSPSLCKNLFYKDDLCIFLQETVSASQRTFTARELRSGIDYLVTVIAQYPNSVGESVSAKQRTSK